MHAATHSWSAPDEARALYLDLLKRALTNWTHAGAELKPMHARGLSGLVRRAVVRVVAGRHARLVRPFRFDPEKRAEGRDWPPGAHTMIGFKRLDNLQHCVETVLKDGVPGDLLEAGVWRGGASIFMRAVLKVHGVTNRRVWLADSFAGLPPPDLARYPQDAGSRFHTVEQLAVALEQVRKHFEHYGLLDDQVRFLKGWFKDTLPAAPVERLAVARLDGDMYESTLDAISSLYPKLSPGGFLIVDDYGAVPACKQAIHDYRDRHAIREAIVPIDWTGVYWRRAA